MHAFSSGVSYFALSKTAGIKSDSYETSVIFIILLLFFPTGTMIAADGGTALPAFPGAEGFGRYTVGGRGGKVYHVTTLEDGEQEGTLRYAVNKKGARTVVFDVSGNIFLNRPLQIVNDSLTIAGQTAPGRGVCIARYPVTIKQTML